MALPHFWSTVRRKGLRFEHMQTVIQTSRRLDSFLHESAQKFEVFSNIQERNKKIKNQPIAARKIFPKACDYGIQFLKLQQDTHETVQLSSCFTV